MEREREVVLRVRNLPKGGGGYGWRKISVVRWGCARKYRVRDVFKKQKREGVVVEYG